MALEADDDRLARATNAVVLLGTNLDALSDVPITEAAELRANQVLYRVHFGVEELVRICLRQLESSIALLELLGKLSVSLDASGRLEQVLLSLR